MLKKHLEWAEANPEIQEAKHFLNLAGMYTKHPDPPTYGLLMAAAEAIERLWKNNAES